jgi:LPXTG-site transpeptidase (sortase) family protein
MKVQARVGVVALVLTFGLGLILPGMRAEAARLQQQAGPQAALTLPAEGMIGEPVTFTVAFSNAGSATGYGPYLDLILPAVGADGAVSAPSDGLSFQSAAYLGLPLNPAPSAQTFPPGAGNIGCVEHLFAVNTQGDPLEVCGPSGDQLVTLLMPFGSFVPAQPPAEVTVRASLSGLADLSTPLTVQARAGFQFGADPLNNPASDPSITSGLVSASIRPTLIRLTKTYHGPEDETATGPNFPLEYSIAVDIAAGQVVTDLRVTDLLPPNMQYVALVSSSPAVAGPETAPPADQPAPPENNALTVLWPSVTGSASEVDATFRFRFFIPRADAAGAAVLDPLSGDDAQSPDDARAAGVWTPMDARDTAGPVVSDAQNPDHILVDKSIAIQKGGAIAADSAGPGLTPGDVIEYTLNFQVSDLFAFANVEIEDILQDGQRFDDSFPPTLSIESAGFDLPAAAVDPLHYVVDISRIDETDDPEDPASDGSTWITFDVAAEAAARLGRPGERALLVGGCVDPAGMGGAPGENLPDCALFNTGPTRGELRFRAVVQESFSDTYLPNNPSVDQGDILDNRVTIRGDVLHNHDLTPTGQVEVDGSGEQMAIARGSLEKTVYAINGLVGSYTTPPQVAPGDTITYRMTYHLPTGDLEDYYLEDYLPLPVFDAAEIAAFDAVVGPDAPAAGRAKFGPSDTFYAYSNLTPALTTSGRTGSNTARFTFGDYAGLSNAAFVTDILLTVTVRSDPFADRLFLTNQVRAHEGSTNADVQVADSIVQIQLTEPVLRIRKGVVWSNRSSAVFSPASVGPVTFQGGAGSCGARLGGTVNSQGLAASPVDSNLAGVDAGDRVMFAVVVENTGSGLNGAFDVRVLDQLPSGLDYVAGSLCVTDGTGAPISFTGLDGGGDGDFFDAGILLDDPGPTLTPAGSLDPYSPTSGRNLAVISYLAQVAGSAPAYAGLANAANLFYYSGQEGGADFTIPDLTDTALVQTLRPALVKTITGTNQLDTTGTNVAVGEMVAYEVVVTVPEGVTPNAVLEDTLDAGLAFVSCDSVTVSANITPADLGCAGVQFAAAPAGSSAPENAARAMTLPFGDIINTDTNNAVDETITVRYTTVVINAAAAVRGSDLNNQAALRFTGGSSLNASAPNVRVVEPALQVVKAANPAAGDAGDTITFTITLSHAGASNADAYNVTLTDVVPAGMTLTPTSWRHTGGLAPTSIQESGATLTAAWDTFARGSTSSFTFEVTLGSGAFPGQTITNAATAAWTSLPGDVGAAQTGNNTRSCERTGRDEGCAGASASYQAVGSAVVTTTAGQNKSILVTSEGGTTLVSGTENAAIGEVIRYRLETTWAEGVAAAVRITDRLPVGLQYLPGTARLAFVCSSGPGCMTSSTAIGSAPVVEGNQATLASIQPTFVLPDSAVSGGPFGSGTDPVFNLGDLANYDRDPDVEYVVIEFNAFVRNQTGTGGNARGTMRANDFQLVVGGQAPSTSNAVSVRIAEPGLALIKALTTAPVDAGDPVVYTITATNTATGAGAAPLYDVRITDVLHPNLQFDSIAITAPAGAEVINTTAAPTIEVIVLRLAPGESMTLVVTARLSADVEAGWVLPNNANATGSSLPGQNGTTPNPSGSTPPGAPGTVEGERIYIASVTTDATLTGPAIDKLPEPTPTSAVPGALVTYDIRVTLPEGWTRALRVTDTLPDGLLYESYSIDTTGYLGMLPVPVPNTPVASGDDLVLDFGDVQTAADNDPSNNSFIVRVRVYVLNTLPVQNGETLQNTASLAYFNPNTGATTVADLTPVLLPIREPELEMIKAADTSAPRFGVPFGYSLTARHLGSSTADAYDVVEIVDQLPAGMVYAPGSAVAPTGWTVDESALPELTFRGPALLLGEEVLFRYQVTLAPPPANALEGPLTNTSTLTWTSLPGNAPYERTGAGGLNDYSAAAEATVTVTGPDMRLSKDDGGVSASGGEQIVYTLTFVNDGNGLAQGVVLTETVPAHTTFVPGSETPDWTCTAGGGAGDSCTLVVGDVPAGASGSRSFTVRVVTPLPAGVEEVENTASVSHDPVSGLEPSPENNVDTDVTPLSDAPDLTLEKSDEGAAAAPGGVVAYILTYTNAGSQGAAGVTITETVPQYSTFAAAASDPRWTCAGGGVAGETCTLLVGDLPANASGSVTFAVTAAAALPAGVEQIENTAVVEDDGANGVDPTPENNTDTETTPSTAAPDLWVIKDDAEATAAPGGTITYTITYGNRGSQDATGVTLGDILPEWTGFAWDSESDVRWICEGDWVALDPCVLDLGDLPAGATGSVTLVVRVDETLPAGVNFIFNTVTIDDDGSNGEDPTSGDRSDDEETPLSAAPDLRVEKDDGDVSTAPGGVVVYTIRYSNGGTQSATGVTLTETVPAGARFSTDESEEGWECVDGVDGPQTCTFAVGELGPGEEGELLFAVMVDDALPAGLDALENSVSIGDDGENGEDLNPEDNTAGDQTPLAAAPDLSIVKNDGLNSVAPGASLTYTLTVTNRGSQGADGVMVVDTLPAGLQFVAASDGGIFDASARTVTWQIGVLGAGESALRTLAAQVENPLPAGVTALRNTATVTDDGANGADPTPEDNQAADENAIAVSGKRIAASNQDFTALPAVAVGELITYEVRLTVAPGRLENLMLTDTLERGLALVDCEVEAAPVLQAQPAALGRICDTRRTVRTWPVGSANPADAGRAFTLDFGALENTSSAPVDLVVRYRAVVLNSTENLRGTQAANSAEWRWTGGTLPMTAPAVRVAEPELEIEKRASAEVALPGGVVTFTITIGHSARSDTDALDVTLRDTLPKGLELVPGSLKSAGGPPPTALDESGAPTLRARWERLPLGGPEAVIQFQARLLPRLDAGTRIRNTATVDWSSLPGRVTDPASPHNPLSVERRYRPTSTVDVYGASAEAEIRTPDAPELPATGFAPGRVTPLPAQPAGKTYTDLGSLWIEIPALELKLPITGAPLQSDGWDLTWLGEQAGWLEGTAFPGWKGNSVLTAHATLPNGGPGPFARLNALRWGDVVLVHSHGEVYRYEVRQNRATTPDDTMALRHEERPVLTLITCRLFDPATGGYRQRVVIWAVRTE